MRRPVRMNVVFVALCCVNTKQMSTSTQRLVLTQMAPVTGLDGTHHTTQELLEQLTFAEECGKLIMPPCWKTGDHCTGKLVSSTSARFQISAVDLQRNAFS